MSDVSVPLLRGCVLVRTDFTSDDKWREVWQRAAATSGDGFKAQFDPVDDRAFDGASWRAVLAAFPTEGRTSAVAFAADDVTMASPDCAILVLDLQRGSGRPRRPFRCIAKELWSVENNLNLANMSWEEFAEDVADDGAFRGFSPPPSPRSLTDVERRGVAAAHRIRSVLYGGLRKRPSGRRVTVSVARVVPASAEHLFPMVRRMPSWMLASTETATAANVGDRYISRGSRYGSADPAHDSLGEAAIRGEYLVVDEPHRLQVSWDWLAPPPPKIWETHDVPAFLPWTTILTFDLEQLNNAGNKAATRITATHTDIPIEWADLMTDYWGWHLYRREQALARPKIKRA